MLQWIGSAQAFETAYLAAKLLRDLEDNSHLAAAGQRCVATKGERRVSLSLGLIGHLEVAAVLSKLREGLIEEFGDAIDTILRSTVEVAEVAEHLGG